MLFDGEVGRSKNFSYLALIYLKKIYANVQLRQGMSFLNCHELSFDIEKITELLIFL